MSKLTHTDIKGQARMVDVGEKPLQQREASATGFIRLKPETIQLIKDNLMKKGDVLAVAQIAGIQAAKKTDELIPLCHRLSLSHLEIDFETESTGIRSTSKVKYIGQTGVEMEALTAVSISLLTIYDMCKAVDKTMKIEEIVLLNKTKKNLP